jgi:L-fuculose-phosphate aldolase
MDSFQAKYRDKIEELVTACRRSAELGYVTSSGGNLSIRADDNVVLITPTKTLKRTMRFEDICAVDLDGRTIYAPEGKAPTGETPFHARIMRKRSDINAIVHAHPPVLTGFAIAGGDLLRKPFLPEPVIEVGPILTVPYDTPLSESLSEKFDQVINLSNGFLMENHGAVFCSPHTITDAVERMQMVECMALSILTASLLGNAKPIEEKYIKELDEVIHVRKLPMPGKPGMFSSASELYRM